MYHVTLIAADGTTEMKTLEDKPLMAEIREMVGGNPERIPRAVIVPKPYVGEMWCNGEAKPPRNKLYPHVYGAVLIIQ